MSCQRVLDKLKGLFFGFSMEMGKGIVFANGTSWKNQRRMFQSYLNKTAIRKYWGILERETRSYPLRVLDGQDTPLEGLRLYVPLPHLTV